MEKRIFIYHSYDIFWIQSEIKKQVDLLEKSGENISVTKLRFPEDSIEQAIDALLTLSFTSKKNVVCINNYDHKTKKNDLINLIDACREDCLLFLYKETPRFTSKAFEEVVRNRKEVSITIEYFIKEQRIRNRLKQFSKETKIHFEKEAEEKLLAFFIDNPLMWKTETEKIAMHFYHPQKKEITVFLKDLNNLINWSDGGSREFAITNMLLGREITRGITLLEQHLNQRGNLLGIVAILQKSYEKILRFKELQQQQISEEKILQRLSVYYTKEKNALFKHDRIYTIPSILSMMNGLIELEKLLKSESYGHSHVGQTPVNLKAKLFLYRLFFSVPT